MSHKNKYPTIAKNEKMGILHILNSSVSPIVAITYTSKANGQPPYSTNGINKMSATAAVKIRCFIHQSPKFLHNVFFSVYNREEPL